MKTLSYPVSFGLNPQYRVPPVPAVAQRDPSQAVSPQFGLKTLSFAGKPQQPAADTCPKRRLDYYA